MSPRPGASDLCETCRQFDVRRLLLEAKAKGPPATAPGAEYGEHHDAIPRFFKHHCNLTLLRDSRRSCALCSEIWIQCGKAAALDSASSEQLGMDYGTNQIWLETSQWVVDLNGLPCIQAVQYGLRPGASRLLASFEAVQARPTRITKNSDLLGLTTTDSSGSSECLAIAREWIRGCDLEHEQCKQYISNDPPLPRRVVEVFQRKAKDEFVARVVDSEGDHARYTALSYCWGGPGVLMLTRETEQELRNGIPLHVLPATLRDALLVTHGLGISFMWVDCLCIEQDNKLDWGREALNMQQVYRNATITLRAACTDSVTQSLFPRRPSRTQYCALEWRDDEASKQTIYLRPGLAFSTMTTEKATISNRGWTLEEDLLAPRTLTFGKQQVWFDCAKGRFDEAGRHTAPAEDYSNKANLQALYSEQGIHKWAARLARTIGLPPVISINLPYWAANAMRIAQQQQFWFQGTFHFAGGSTFTYFDLWRQIIDQFSARKLTHSRDVFLALAGVARAFQQTHGDEYIAGMWRSDLVRSLTWNRLAAHRRKRDHSILIDLPSPPIRYMAPSWSWASITGRKVNFLGSLGSDGGTFTPIAKVQAVHLMPQSGSVFGPLMEDSSITLYAPVIGIPDPREPVKDGPLQLVREYIQLLLQTEANTGHEFSQQHEGHEGQEFTLMHLGNYEDWRHWHFYTALLLLESCASSTACKRIGRFVFTMPGRDPVFTDIREDTLRCKEFLDTKMKSRTIRIV